MAARIFQDSDLLRIYRIFNSELFKGKLPQEVYVGLVPSLRDEGYFVANKQEKGGQLIHEIIIDERLVIFDRDYWLVVFVHQMVHLWQWEFGKQKSPDGYHNLEFRRKMNEIGIDVKTDYGQSIECTINEDGRLRSVITEFANELKVSVTTRNPFLPGNRKSKGGKRAKYTCLNCGCLYWGKFNLAHICSVCYDKTGEIHRFVYIPEEGVEA